jgi:gas vesicle protein
VPAVTSATAVHRGGFLLFAKRKEPTQPTASPPYLTDEKAKSDESETLKEYEMSTWKFWAAFGVGVAAGAALALIYAPQSGARTRRQIKRAVNDAGEYIKDTADNVQELAGKYIKRGKDAVDDVVDQAQNVVTSAKRVTTWG